MKLSANTLGIITFTAIATTAFAWMAKRPAIEGQIIQFGMPLQASDTTENTNETPAIVDEKTIENSSNSTPADGSQSADDQANNPEPEKATEDSSNKNKEKEKKK